MRETRNVPEPASPPEKAREHPAEQDHTGLNDLQRSVGNQAIQRAVARRRGAHTLDAGTASRVQAERGAGQPLDRDTRRDMQRALGADFSEVRIHTDAESDQLNRAVNAKAFATGHDVFFREGHYEPHSTEGRELLAHELAHVVQQGQGPVASESGSGMKVNAPHDRHEQQADRMARGLSTQADLGGGPDLQRASLDEEEETLQTASLDEEEETLQTASLDEEEETLQTASLDEEEETLQTKRADR